jgi:hypothetical protein
MKFKENKKSSRREQILERALKECIKQFDFSGNMEWRKDFKHSMIRIATLEIEEEEDCK